MGRLDDRHEHRDSNRLLRVDRVGNVVNFDMPQGWLFRLRGRGAITTEGRQCTIAADFRCNLNPTRFLAHQPDPTLARIRARSPIEALRENQELADALSATTLDGNDNILVGLQYAGGTTFDERRRTWWNGVLEIYWHQIEALLRQRFSADGLATVRRLDYVGTTAAEVYWELETADAVSWATAFRDVALAAHHQAEARSERAPSQSGRMNSRWIVITLPAGISIKVYAKTDRRVRFEVTFAQGRVGQHARRAGARSSNAYERLSSLCDEGAERLARAYQEIAPEIGVRPQLADLCEFLSRFNGAVPDENRALLLRLLLNHRSVAVHSQVPLSVCRALVRVGILRRRRLASRDHLQFSLEPEYEALARTLAGGLNPDGE
ncbi:MAG: hypothetical protein LCH88_04730 [Proteobacteria bacterium]|nr:hypothetical protein [Pseudomonadota bacterium]